MKLVNVENEDDLTFKRSSDNVRNVEKAHVDHISIESLVTRAILVRGSSRTWKFSCSATVFDAVYKY